MWHNCFRLLTTTSHLLTGQVSTSFECLETCTFMYATPTLTTKALHLATQIQLCTFNDCYSELMPYTALAYSYWVSFHEAYQCQGHVH